MATHKWEDNHECRSEESKPHIGLPIQDTAPERQTPQTSVIEVQWSLHAAEPKGYRKERLQSLKVHTKSHIL